MPRTLVYKERFKRSYQRLTSDEQERVKKSLRLLERYLLIGEAPGGLGIKKLGTRLYEFRAGLSLRGVYVEEGSEVILALLGSHDEVCRFIRSSR